MPLAIMVLGALHAPGEPPPVGLEIVPGEPPLAAFERAADLVPLWRQLLNSLTVVAIAVPVTVAVSSMTGFAMSRLCGLPHAAAVGFTLVCPTIPLAALWVPRFARAGGAGPRAGRRPRVLLLDEPLSNLDAQLRAGARTEIRRVQERTGVATLHVTHDQDEALAHGHRVAVLHEGRVVQVGTPDELWERPASTWIARFVGTPPMNIVHAPIAGLEAPDGLVGFRAEEAKAQPDEGSAFVFELAERVGAQRFWHLRAGEEAAIVRAPDGAAPPPRGAAVRVSVPPHAVRRFDAGGRAVK